MQRSRNLKSINVTCAEFLSMPKKARRWMGVDSGWPVDSEQLASPAFQAGIWSNSGRRNTTGTTVVNTDQPVVRKTKSDSTFFAVN
jgi:hypothetical protein